MLRVAITSAKLGHPEVRIGAVAGWGGTTRRPRLIGKSLAVNLTWEAVHRGLDLSIVESAKLGADYCGQVVKTLYI